MIYLSNFGKNGKHKDAVSIARIPPKWYTGEKRKDLAPKLSTLTAFKKGKITTVQYIDEYCKVVYAQDLDKLAKELDGKILLCFCSKNDLCHRFLLGLILKIETGAEIKEVGGFGDDFEEIMADGDHPIALTLTEEDKDKYNLHGKFKDDDIIGHWRELKELGALDIFSDWSKT